MMAVLHEGSYDLTRKAGVDQTEVRCQQHMISLQEKCAELLRAPVGKK